MENHSSELHGILSDLNIKYHYVDHPEVFTVEAMMPYLANCKGLVCKNLFVKDKKKKLWLLVACHDKEIKLAEVAKLISARGGLRFADESVLYEKLKVLQGCVTPMAIYNDLSCDVTVVLDKTFVENPQETIYCHPMSNAASIGIKSSDFLKFLQHCKHEPLLIEL
uniref:PrdX deacylase domain-containing protein 1 n=1 Tax=Phallusia mammillata TaxID=59560 RepID=A0A6F9DPS3_9ASCI|nr:prolyl-tRNA synthetase associated domain-containing protein 1-like [Phallusia mammillata]